MADEPRTATEEEVSAARKRVAEKREAIKAATREAAAARPEVRRGKQVSRLEDEEKRLDAELRSVQSGGISNPLPSPPTPPSTETAPQADDFKKGGDS